MGDSTECSGSLTRENLVFISAPGNFRVNADKFKFCLGPCHIKGVNNGTHISFVSSVNWEDGAANAIISHSRMIRVDFECVLPTMFTVSLDNGLTPLIAKVRN